MAATSLSGGVVMPERRPQHRSLCGCTLSHRIIFMSSNPLARKTWITRFQLDADLESLIAA